MAVALRQKYEYYYYYYYYYAIIKVFTRLNAAAFIILSRLDGRRLFEGGVYYYDPALRARCALIRSREIDEHGCSRQPELGHGQSYIGHGN